MLAAISQGILTKYYAPSSPLGTSPTTQPSYLGELPSRALQPGQQVKVTPADSQGLSKRNEASQR